MKYKLIKPINPNYDAEQQILTNRGIKKEEIYHYLNTTDYDINEPEALGEKEMAAAASILIQCISKNKNAVVLVDCDNDGYTSAAILINYLYLLFPSWTKSHVSWILHTGKQHGLSDVIDNILSLKELSLVLTPDAATNDTIECQQLYNNNIQCIVLDHHLKEQDNPYAVIINSQLNDYPNSELSGAGVTWQFCRYIDKLLEKNYANNFLDLVALGLTGDMMSMTSFETKHLINKGFKNENLKNPFITYLADKNSFSLGETITPIGAAFYLVPFVNAVVRSGTQDEKELMFKSMLNFCAFEEVPSTKRGHALGQTEKIVEQAVRTVTNVKARQTKAQNEGMEKIEARIEKEGLLQHKVLMILLDKSENIEKNILGLIANKLMSKYQRPVCVLTHHDDLYSGSARGCDIIGVSDFKQICQQSGVTEYTIGHLGAFGACIKANQIENFLRITDNMLKDISNEPIYYIDYIFNNVNVDPNFIFSVASMGNLWGKDFDEPLVLIRNLQVTPDMITIYNKKNTTIKIALPNGVSIMFFNATLFDCETLQNYTEGSVTIDIIGTCHRNEWMGYETPQIFVTDYQKVKTNKIVF